MLDKKYKFTVLVQWHITSQKEKHWVWSVSNNPNIEYKTYGTTKKLKIIGYLLASIKALTKKSDLVIINTIYPAFLFCFLNKFFKKKCIIHEFLLSSKWNKKKAFVRWIFKDVDRFVVFSKSEVDYYNTKFSIPRKKLFWIPLRFPIPEAPLIANKNSNGYMFAGGKSQRDYLFLIDVLKEIGAKAIIICGKKYYSTVNGFADRNICIVEWLDEKEFWMLMLNSKYVVIPLSEENISCGQLTFMSAMAFGKAVVVPKVAATEEYILDGITGFFYKYGQRHSLLKVLNQLEENPKLAEAVGKSAREEIMRKYNAKDYIKNIEKMCFEISDLQGERI